MSSVWAPCSCLINPNPLTLTPTPTLTLTLTLTLTRGACSTGSEFYDNWFQSPRKDLEAAGLLTEHFKQSDLGVACAISATAALEKKEGKLDKTNEKLVDYLSKSGAWPAEENGIKTVRSLLDMMMITGVIHGSWLLAL